jgi:hypothetical protein
VLVEGTPTSRASAQEGNPNHRCVLGSHLRHLPTVLTSQLPKLIKAAGYEPTQSHDALEDLQDLFCEGRETPRGRAELICINAELMGNG